MTNKLTGKQRAAEMRKQAEKKRSALDALKAQNGKDPETMQPKELARLVIALGQLLNVVNAEGKIEVA